MFSRLIHNVLCFLLVLINSLLYGYTKFVYPCVSSWMFLLFALLAVMNNAVMSIMHKFVGGHYVFISLGYIPTSGIARSYGHSMFNF